MNLRSFIDSSVRMLQTARTHKKILADCAGAIVLDEVLVGTTLDELARVGNTCGSALHVFGPVKYSCHTRPDRPAYDAELYAKHASWFRKKEFHSPRESPRHQARRRRRDTRFVL